MSSSVGQPATISGSIPYQGFPYINPVVNDVPSLNPAEVAALNRWTNLPKRQFTPVRSEAPGGSCQIQSPDHQLQDSSSAFQPPPKKEEEDRPVVYIDIPESSGSEVSQRREGETEHNAFVQDTIFYDPFKDRRINIGHEDSGSDDSVSAGASSPPSRPTRPAPPVTLDLNTPGSSSGYNSLQTPTSNQVPPFLSKESYVYGRQPTPDDGFNLTPIPVSEFPVSPPAYEDIDRPQRPEPPRTQVITSPDHPPAPICLQGDRKLIRCYKCNTVVQTVTVRENGRLTHIIGIFFLIFGMFPISIMVYWTPWFKYKNHYCPLCNSKIAYEIPMACQGLTYYNEAST